MREAGAKFLAAGRDFALAYRLLVRTIARKYWGPSLLIMTMIGLSVLVGILWWIVHTHGVVPTPAAKIEAFATWVERNGQPVLQITGRRYRFVDCSGMNGHEPARITRMLVYAGRGDVPAMASYATSGNLDYRPIVTSRKQTADINPFGLEIPVANVRDLVSVRWTLDAFAGSCTDGEERSLQPVGLIPVPPYPKYPRPAAETP